MSLDWRSHIHAPSIQVRRCGDEVQLQSRQEFGIETMNGDAIGPWLYEDPVFDPAKTWVLQSVRWVAKHGQLRRSFTCQMQFIAKAPL